MNIIEFLREKKDNILTIQKYDLTDLASSYHIRFLVDNQILIKDYFNTNNILTLYNAEQYYDYLYLEYIIKFEDHIEDISEEYGKPLKELIEYSKEKKLFIKNSHIIRCIQANYQQIFELAKRLTDTGLMKETLDFMIRFYSGLKDCGAFQYLITEHTYFAFDNFENLFDILKKNNQEFLRMLMVYNLHNISRMRFKDICNVIKELYHKNYIEIARESGQKVFDNIIERYNQREDEYSLQGDLKVAYDALYYCKLEEAKELIPIIRKIDEEVDKRIVETGHEFKYEFSTEPYINWMEENRKVAPLSRYLTVSHEMSEEMLWVSHLVQFSSSFEPSVLDRIASSPNTNDYFSYSRKSRFEICITAHCSKLLYWFSEDILAKEFNQSFKTVIDSIFEIANYNTEFENLHENIDGVTQIMREAVERNERGICLFNKLMFIISFLEKVLRMVYIALDDKIFFEKNITLGAVFGKENNLNPVMLRVLGEHHLRWTRYYLLKDDEEVGLEYRNRIAHLRDINPNEISIFEFLKVVWIIISTMNSILVNLINDEHMGAEVE